MPRTSSSSTKKTNKRTRLSQAERREQLVRGSVKVASDVGLGRLAHAAVARECAVSVPTVFSYFENRTALVLATVEEVKRFYIELADYWHRPEIPPHTAIEGHFTAYLASIKEDPHYARVWLEWGTAVRNEEGIWDSFLDYHNEIIKRMASSIRRGQKLGEIGRSIDAKNAARLVLAAGTALTQMYFMDRSRAEMSRFIRQSVQLALHEDL